MINVSNPPKPDIPTTKHVISTSQTIAAGESAVVVRYIKIAAGVTLKIDADADLKIL